MKHFIFKYSFEFFSDMLKKEELVPDSFRNKVTPVSHTHTVS